MLAHKLIVQIPKSRRLEIMLPEDSPEGEAEVVVLFAKQAHEAAVPGSRDAILGGLVAVNAWRTANPEKLKSREEIDAYLQEERDSWNDD